MDILPDNQSVPHLCTIKKAASIVGIQYRQLLQAVQEGKIPHYQLGQSRKLLNVSEVITIMKNDGGCHE